MRQSVRHVITNSRTGILSLVLLSSMACSSFPGHRQAIPVSTYVLTAPDNSFPVAGNEQAACLTLLVNPMQSVPGFETAAMAYVRKDYQLEYFANHQWVDAPARMLTPVLARAIERSGLFKNVASAPASIVSDLRLDTQLLGLQQVFDEGSSIKLTIRAMLINQTQGNIVASRIFSISEPVSINSPYGGVLAANQALGQLLAELVEFLAKLSPADSCAVENRGEDSAKTSE